MEPLLNRHDHEHGDNHNHDHDHEHNQAGQAVRMEQLMRTDTGRFCVKGHLLDGAAVISAECTLNAEYEVVRALLQTGLEKLAESVSNKGGVIGHIKAAAEFKAVDMFSVTDSAVSVRRASEQEIVVRIAAIVFFIEVEEAKEMVETTILNNLKALAK